MFGFLCYFNVGEKSYQSLFTAQKNIQFRSFGHRFAALARSESNTYFVHADHASNFKGMSFSDNEPILSLVQNVVVDVCVFDSCHLCFLYWEFFAVCFNDRCIEVCHHSQ